MRDNFTEVLISSLFTYFLIMLVKKFSVELYTQEEGLTWREVVRGHTYVPSKPSLLFQNINLFHFDF